MPPPQTRLTAIHGRTNADACKKTSATLAQRCYLYQHAHRPGQCLAPYYVLHVKKTDGKGMDQQRVLTLDLLEGVLQNWKKDEPHRCTPLAQIAEVRSTGDTTFTLAFTKSEKSSQSQRDYKLSADSPAQCDAYTSVLRSIGLG